MSWRDRWVPSSFRGAGFNIDTGARAGGRRGVTFEYPKRNTPSDEDMGRRAQRFAITGYLIGPDYDLDAQDLEDALNADGPGRLVHPTMGEMLVRCETYTRSERKQEGNLAVFEMSFVEVGASAFDLASEPTQFNLQTKADAAAPALATQSDTKAADLVST